MNKFDDERAALRRLASGNAMAAGSEVVPLIRRATRAILLLLWVLAIITAVSSGILLLHHARSHAEGVATSLEQYARRTITLAAFVVDEYQEHLDERGGLAGLAQDAATSQRLRDLATWLPDGSTAGVVASDGTYLASNAALGPNLARPTDRQWFQAHVRDGLQSFIGPAILSRVSNRYVFTYSAAYRAKDEELLGVIVLGIPSNSITGLATDQRHTSMALVEDDGAVVAAQPFHPEMVDERLPWRDLVPEPKSTGVATVFGAWSVVAVRTMPDLKLHAIAAVPLFEVLKPLLWGIGIGLPVLLLLTRLLRVLSNQLQKKSRQVEQALADNKVLFQEVHHRVKNNLQVISSLLRLQSERLPAELRPLLDQTGARVRAIALVHEQIYRTASPSDVQLDKFLAQLVQQLSASMIAGTARIMTDLQPMTIGLDRAVPVAILATEAITNAIKHGLEDGDGAITVRLASQGGVNRIEVHDSGRGIGDDADTGLGSRIMTALSRQIDGTWSREPAPSGGTSFTLSWPASA
ncbi:MAG: histidine kinase dimerization/phosphoacceptor domain -containing protein [Hyphomicrobiales bacterium]